MPHFMAIRIKPAHVKSQGAWGVERSEGPDGPTTVTSRFFATKHEAEIEANRLNLEVSHTMMDRLRAG